MPKVRVLHTLCRIFSGGVEQRRLQLARGLPKDDYVHALICQDTKGPIARELIGEGWEVHEIGLARHILDPRWHAKAHNIAKAFRPDVVHGAVYEGVALAAGIGVRMPRVTVISEETSDPVDRRWTGNLLMRTMLARSQLCIGVSPRAVEYLTKTIHVPRRKVRLIANAVVEVAPSSAHDLAQLRRRFGIRDGQLVIGSVGRVQDDHKRFSDIVRAMPGLLAKHPSVRLLIVGDGDDVAMLQALTGRLNVSNAVVFTGYQANTRPFYEIMDLFVLASAHEAFGLVLVEAMLAGAPIVATRVGGIPFVLDEGRVGRLVPPGSPKVLASAISELLTDDDERQRLRTSGLERARTMFSTERYCHDVDSLYRSVAAKSQPEP